MCIWATIVSCLLHDITECAMAVRVPCNTLYLESVSLLSDLNVISQYWQDKENILICQAVKLHPTWIICRARKISPRLVDFHVGLVDPHGYLPRFSMTEIGTSSRNGLASKISKVGLVTQKIIFLALIMF
jgi:hypothetical protein